MRREKEEKKISEHAASEARAKTLKCVMNPYRSAAHVCKRLYPCVCVCAANVSCEFVCKTPFVVSTTNEHRTWRTHTFHTFQLYNYRRSATKGHSFNPMNVSFFSHFFFLGFIDSHHLRLACHTCLSFSHENISIESPKLQTAILNQLFVSTAINTAHFHMRCPDA